MKQAFLVLGISLGCFIATSASAATYTYVLKGITQNWSSPGSWNPPGPPPAGSTVIIAAGGTLVLDTSATVDGLNLTNTLLQMDSGQTLDLAGPATVGSDGEIDLGDGTLKGDANGQAAISISGGGGFLCSGGSFLGIISLTVATNAFLYLYAPPSPFSGSVTLTNYGTVNWDDVNITNTSGSSLSIYNYGLWDAKTNNMISGVPGGEGTIFNNYGTFRKDGGVSSGVGGSGDYTELDPNTTFNNFGTVDIESGLLEVFTGTSFGGSTFNTVSNSDTGFGNNYLLAGDVTFTGAGLISGALNGSNAVLHGTVAVSFMTFSNTLTLAANCVLYVSPIPGQPVSFAGTVFTNYGTVVWTNTDLYGQSSPQIYNYGLWDAKTNNTFHGAASPSKVSAGGTTIFNNYGTFRESGGGSLITAPATFDNNTAFNNYGLLDLQVGALELDGSYSLAGGTLNFGITGPNQCGELSIPGVAQLAGGLSVNFTNNFSPAANDAYALVGAGSELGETGIFDPLTLPSLPPPLAWQANYGTNDMDFELVIVSALPPQMSTSMNVNGNSISLSWSGLPGQTYQVQSATNLLQPDWVNLGSPISGANDAITISDTAGGSPQKFYRLELQ